MHIAFLILVSLALASAVVGVLITAWWAAGLAGELVRAALTRKKPPPLGYDVEGR